MKTFDLVSTNNKFIVSVMLLSLFHFSGLIGIQSQYQEWFLKFTPLNLVISSSLLFWNHEKLNKKIILSFILIFLLGLSIEIIGIKTGMIFGHYEYGDTLGFKFMEVPLVIGMNWASLCLASACFISKYKLNNIQKAFLCSFIPVSIDFFIEQLCDKLNFWSWQNSQIPLQNFFSWYIFTFIFTLILIPNLKDSSNKLAPYYLAIQFIFFVFLNIFL